MRYIAAIVLALAGSGCAADVTGNDQSLVVKSFAFNPDQDAFQTAERHCGTHGKKAQLVSKRGSSEFVFHCVR